MKKLIGIVLVFLVLVTGVFAGGKKRIRRID
jgi:hypothetical protein